MSNLLITYDTQIGETSHAYFKDYRHAILTMEAIKELDAFFATLDDTSVRYNAQMLAEAIERDTRNAHTGWYNGVDFKEYLIMQSDLGPVVPEVCAYHVYCQDAQAEAEESFDEAEAYYGANV